MTHLPFSRFLVRLRPEDAARLKASGTPLAAAGVSLELEPDPILRSGPKGAARGLTGGGWEWHVALPPQSIAGAHAWELAHALSSRALGVSGGADVVIEPDFE